MPEEDLGFVHVYVPAQPGERRTLLLLHGTGGDETSLLRLGPELAPGAGLLSPRGNVLEGTAPRFFRRLAEGVFDIADLKQRTLELAAFIGHAAGAYGFDPHQVTAVGYSNGANIAASLLLTRPETVGGAILFRAMLPFEPETPPRLNGTPIYLGAGRRDPLVAPPLVERLAAVFQQGGAEVELRWRDAGHGLAPGELAEARAWLDRTGPAASRDRDGLPRHTT